MWWWRSGQRVVCSKARSIRVVASCRAAAPCRSTRWRGTPQSRRSSADGRRLWVGRQASDDAKGSPGEVGQAGRAVVGHRRRRPRWSVRSWTYGRPVWVQANTLTSARPNMVIRLVSVCKTPPRVQGVPHSDPTRKASRDPRRWGTRSPRSHGQDDLPDGVQDQFGCSGKCCGRSGDQVPAARHHLGQLALLLVSQAPPADWAADRGVSFRRSPPGGRVSAGGQCGALLEASGRVAGTIPRSSPPASLR